MVREQLLSEVLRFVRRASVLRGVQCIALIGSLATSKPEPKDADVLVVVGTEIDFQTLASAGRGLEGAAQALGKGADIFLANSTGRYLGRTCSYRECHPRVACGGHQCFRGTYLKDDFERLRLSAVKIAAPPVELWPTVICRGRIPGDVRQRLIEPLKGEQVDS